MKKILTVLTVVSLLAVGTNAAFEKINTYSNNFSDVKDTSWYADNVKTAYELGFMNGKSEGKFDPDGNVTVVEGITMASRLHAIYRGGEVKVEDSSPKEVRFDFDDPSIIVDLSERNSRNNGGVTFNHAVGKVEEGCLVVQPDKPNASGAFDPGIFVEGLELETRNYNKLKFRMRRDMLPNTDPEKKRSEIIEIFFKTNVSPKIDGEKRIVAKLNEIPDLADWFEIEIELAEHEFWKDTVTGIRFDPTNNNGIYYIDYIVFSKSEDKKYTKWYDLYLEYALANGIIKKDEYLDKDYNRNITREELCRLFVSAVPEENYAPINDVKGIPDVQRDSENADILLMLYKAGVVLGSDKDGNFNPDSDIKRSEVAAIINRVALPENRVKGEIYADWKYQGNKYDLEFNSQEDVEGVEFDAEYTAIENGTLILKALDRGEDAKPRFDPKIIVNGINLNTKEYTKLKIRYKIEILGHEANKVFDFFYMTEEDSNFNETHALHKTLAEYSYVDPAGWNVLEVDFSLNPKWTGNIKAFRFDPANADCLFTVDYIRFERNKYFDYSSHEELVNAGYTATRLMQDEHFERGFLVSSDGGAAEWKDFASSPEKPLWIISPMFTDVDLWKERDTTTDKNTIRDTKGINTITYNPEEKSVSMRLDATKYYNGKAHTEQEYQWWPHLLIEQDKEFCAFDKERNSAAADRMFVEFDIRVTDFKDTINSQGNNVFSFLIYYYLQTDKSPSDLIWFGLKAINKLGANSSINPGWSPDSAAHQYMYGIPQAVIFDGLENTLNPEPGKIVLNEWKHVRLDVTPHIDRAVEWANRDKAFGTVVTKDDLYFSGVNIGFEIHGNYDATVEFKNFNMVAYNMD